MLGRGGRDINKEKSQKRVDTLTFILQFWISRIEESIDYVQVKLGSSMV
jgi:hypothetical protein